MSRGNTALVVGGAGFIGSHLTDRLVARGFRVAVVDNLSSGQLTNVHPSAIFHRVDMTDPAVEAVLQQERPKVLFHLAGQISVTDSVKDPIKDSEINVLGAIRLLEAARRTGVQKIIYSSTGGALYGEPGTNPCTEEHPIAPASPYGISKYVVELHLELYQRLYSIDYVSLRYGNVYGPRQNPQGEAGVVAIFCQAMLEGRVPQVNGDGNQSRDFVYVEDVVDANICAAEASVCGAFNIVTGQGTTVNQIFKMLENITGFGRLPGRGPARAGDVYQICLADIKANLDLGWTPQIPLGKGLRRTVSYFDQNIKAAS